MDNDCTHRTANGEGPRVAPVTLPGAGGCIRLGSPSRLVLGLKSRFSSDMRVGAFHGVWIVAASLRRGVEAFPRLGFVFFTLRDQPARLGLSTFPLSLGRFLLTLRGPLCSNSSIRFSFCLFSRSRKLLSSLVRRYFQADRLYSFPRECSGQTAYEDSDRDLERVIHVRSSLFLGSVS